MASSLTSLKQKDITQALQILGGVKKTYPFDAKVAVYSIGDVMFALLREDTSPLRLSLLCNPELAITLRQRYESIMVGERLNTKKWNTILLTGQLSLDEIKDLMRHAYEMAKIESTDLS